MPAATPPRKSVQPRRGTRARTGAAESTSLLGDGFAVGVATSGYQVEGGYNGDGEPQNNWSAWEGAGRAARSGLACDFWRHPEEALDRAAAIGCNTFRLSVEWARLEPQPGAFDDAALERYAEILSLCTARGLEPIVTLHHFTHPWWLGEEFWLRPGSPDVFARHVARVVPTLAPYCRRWVTINEPNIVTLMGWIEGTCPPGRRMAVSDAFCALDNLLTAHVLAAEAVTDVQPDAEVTVNTSSSSVYEHDRMLLDLLQLREVEVDPGDVDRYIDERRAVHDAAFPPQHAGEAAIRRFFAAVSPYGSESEPGRGAGLGAPARRHAAACAASGGGGGARVAAAAQPRCRRLRLVRPGGQPRPARPGTANAGGPAGLVLRPRLLGGRVASGGAAQLVRHRVRAAPRAPAVGGGERHGDAGDDGRPVPARTAWIGRATCVSTWARWPTPWAPACPCAPTSTGR